MYLCTTNYITEIRLRATNVPLYNQLHHRNQSESYKCTSVQPTTSQKSVWELQMYLCTTNYITEISLRATNVPLYLCATNYITEISLRATHMYLCTTNYITEISLRATHVPLYNQLHHRNQSESYKCTSVQPTTSQKLVWELQMYLCTTNYITEISLRATNVPLYNQLHHRNQSESYNDVPLCRVNQILGLSLRYWVEVPINLREYDSFIIRVIDEDFWNIFVRKFKYKCSLSYPDNDCIVCLHFYSSNLSR